jgi:hypothetical protein
MLLYPIQAFATEDRFAASVQVFQLREKSKLMKRLGRCRFERL